MFKKSSVRERWVGLITEQQSSGISVAEWCTEHKIDKGSFYSWRKRLSENASGVSDSVPQFVKVSFDRGSSSSHVTLHVGKVSLKISSGFDSHLLNDVLNVLEARC